MMVVFKELEERANAEKPLRVGVVGAGFMGRGSVRQLAKVKGTVPVMVANRTLSRAIDALAAAGIARSQIDVTDDPAEAQNAIDSGRFVASSRLDLPALVEAVDVVLETTGHIDVGARIALKAFENGKHLVASNVETQVTLGQLLKKRADEHGVIYSDIDADQSGLIMNLYGYCKGLGLEPVVAGNCKGVMKRYATPETQAAFSIENGIAPWIATSAADGTKLNFEMAAVANATGMRQAQSGMIGVETSINTLLSDFDARGLLAGHPVVEYTLGIPSGVFIVAKTDDGLLQEEFSYLKMGAGPYYLFHDPRVLCHFEVPLSIAKAALFHTATIAPRETAIANVACFAKRNLPAGIRPDGIGGFDCYGLIVSAAECEAGAMLPIGLADQVVLKRDIRQDEPVLWQDVEPAKDSFLIGLWHEQARLFSETSAR